MDNNKPSSFKRVYLSYRDDDEKIVSGYFDLIEESELSIKFRTAKSIITISRSRLIKMKETYQDG